MKKCIYLDWAAGAALLPDAVTARMSASMPADFQSAERFDQFHQKRDECVRDVKNMLAEIFHAPGPERVILMKNATDSVELAVKLFLNDGGCAFTTVMDHQSVLKALIRHTQIPTGRGAWYKRNTRNGGFCAAELSEDGSIDYDSVRETSKRKRPDLLICTAASNVTGDLTDLYAMASIAHEVNSFFVVDAALTGGILTTDMQSLGIDALIFTGYKGLRGPEGIGGIIFGDKIDFNGAAARVDGEVLPIEMRENLPGDFEGGMMNYPGIAGLDAGLRYIKLAGIDHIAASSFERARQFYDEVRQLDQVELYGNYSDYRRMPIVAINIADFSSSRAAMVLKDKYHIIAGSGNLSAPLMQRGLGTDKRGVVRFSFSDSVTEQDVEEAVIAVRELSQGV